MLELWLIRHGESTWNAERRVQGSSDAPLSERGRAQARSLAARLRGEAFDDVVSSDLSRALETARLALPDRVDAIRTDPRLREIDLGRFEGRIYAEMDPDDRAQLDVWFRGPFEQRVEGGESSDDLRTRVAGWLHELPAEGRVAVFSHGGAIGSIFQVVFGRPGQGAFTWGMRLGNTSVSRLVIDGTAVLVDVVNDTSHLDGA